MRAKRSTRTSAPAKQARCGDPARGGIRTADPASARQIESPRWRPERFGSRRASAGSPTGRRSARSCSRPRSRSCSCTRSSSPSTASNWEARRSTFGRRTRRSRSCSWQPSRPLPGTGSAVFARAGQCGYRGSSCWPGSRSRCCARSRSTTTSSTITSSPSESSASTPCSRRPCPCSYGAPATSRSCSAASFSGARSPPPSPSCSSAVSTCSTPPMRGGGSRRSRASTTSPRSRRSR